MALLDDARATALRAMVALASLCPRLQALLLAAAADSVVLLPEPGSAQAASAVADMARAVLAGGHGGTVVVVDVVGVMQARVATLAGLIGKGGDAAGGALQGLTCALLLLVVALSSVCLVDAFVASKYACAWCTGGQWRGCRRQR